MAEKFDFFEETKEHFGVLLVSLYFSSKDTEKVNTSLEELKALGITSPKPCITADPAFRLEPQSDNWIKYVMNRRKIAPGISSDKRYFAVSVRGGATGIDDDELEKLAFASKLISEGRKLTPLIVVLQPLLDDAVSKKLSELTGAPMISGLCASELTGLMTHMEFAVSMRLHLLIYAADAGIPIMALSHDPKLDALCETLKVENCLVKMGEGENALTTDRLLKVMSRLTEENDEFREVIKARVNELRQLAVSDAEYAMSLLRERKQTTL